MNSVLPKQFLPLAGIPILMHAIRAFRRFDPSVFIVVALPEHFLSMWEDLCRKHLFMEKHATVAGGITRFHSVSNALKLIPDQGYVGIHDAVRPLVSPETIRTAFLEAVQSGNAIPCLQVNESVRRVEGEANFPVPRNSLRLIQTPQVFLTALIKKAYSQATHDEYTDDATVLETMGEKIHLVKGNPENIKITHPCDLLLAEVLLKQM